jgi:hypothetical protein
MAKVQRVCLICGKFFYVYPSVIQANNGNYCSKDCHNQSMKGKKKDAWVEIKCQGCGKSFLSPRYRK